MTVKKSKKEASTRLKDLQKQQRAAEQSVRFVQLLNLVMETNAVLIDPVEIVQLTWKDCDQYHTEGTLGVKLVYPEVTPEGEFDGDRRRVIVNLESDANLYDDIMTDITAIPYAEARVKEREKLKNRVLRKLTKEDRELIGMSHWIDPEPIAKR